MISKIFINKDDHEIRGKIKYVAITSATVIMVLSAVTGFVTHIFAQEVVLAHFLHYVLDLLLIFMSWQLFNRKRKAWFIYLVATGFDAFVYFQNFVDYSSRIYLGLIDRIYFAVDLYVLAVLLIFHNSFKRKTESIVSSRAFIPAIILVFDIIFAFLIQKSFNEVIELIIGYNTKPGEVAMFLVFWISLFTTVYFWFSPKIYAATRSKSFKALARHLVQHHGQNPTSYLALEDDKLLFFGSEVEGVVAYGIVHNVVVVLGDPICAEEDFARLLHEFKAYCSENEYPCIFLGTTAKYLDIYDAFGYKRVICGQEARFNLSEYQLAGGKMAKLRAQVNHANKAGITTCEYKPVEGRDKEIERGFDTVSKDWLTGKKGDLLRFTIGGVGLEEPLDRRYFYAKNADGKIVAFNVFTPFMCMDGYMADVTRRTHDAPGGVTEKLIFDGFMAFKEEGLQWGSMGLAPLANVREAGKEEGEKDGLAVKMLELVYEKGNGFYGFKDLYRAKKSYNPSDWLPSYFVYSGKVLTPQMVLAVVSIQSPIKLKDIFGPIGKGLRTIFFERLLGKVFRRKQGISILDLETGQKSNA